MLSFFKKLFGAKSAETVVEVPYKVETPVEVQPEFLAPVKKPRAKKPASEKKPAVKAKTPRKPKAE